MDEQNPPRRTPADPSATDPDELVAHIGRLSVMKTSLISLVFHVLLIGLTSIGFISLCVKHRTLHPKAVLNRLAEEQREAKKAEARRQAREKAMAGRGGKRGSATRPKSPIERKISERSYEKPKPSQLKLPEP